MEISNVDLKPRYDILLRHQNKWGIDDVHVSEFRLPYTWNMRCEGRGRCISEVAREQNIYSYGVSMKCIIRLNVTVPSKIGNAFSCGLLFYNHVGE